MHVIIMVVRCDARYMRCVRCDARYYEGGEV